MGGPCGSRFFTYVVRVVWNMEILGPLGPEDYYLRGVVSFYYRLYYY